MEEFFENEDFKEELANDQSNFQSALDHLIDSVSHFKANGDKSLVDIEPMEWAKMLETLNFATFIISGLMYSYGIPICGHDHDDEDDKEEE
jgi:hypothetical protein